MDTNEQMSSTTETTESTPSLDEQVAEIFDREDNDTSSEPAEDTKEDSDGETIKQDQETSSTEASTVGNKTETDNKQEVAYPEKFKKEDGSVDVEKMYSSYSELESNFTKKMQEYSQKIQQYEKEKVEAQQAEAKSQGFESIDDYQVAEQHKEAIVQGYLNNLGTVEDPDYVQNLIYAFRSNPTQDLLERIEDNFDIGVIKRVTSDADSYANSFATQLVEQRQAEAQEKVKSEATAYVQDAVERYEDMLKVKEIYDFFGDALKVKGCTFKADDFFNHINKLKTYFVNEYKAEQASKKENDNAIKSLQGQTPSNNAGSKKAFDMNNCTPEELESEIARLI